MKSLKDNKTVKILEDAEKGGYGVIAAIVYVRPLVSSSFN
jgi:fructose-bisphosphate aldolase class II